MSKLFITPVETKGNWSTSNSFKIRAAWSAKKTWATTKTENLLLATSSKVVCKNSPNSSKIKSHKSWIQTTSTSEETTAQTIQLSRLQPKRNMSLLTNSMRAKAIKAKRLGWEKVPLKMKDVLRFQISWPEINNKFNIRKQYKVSNSTRKTDRQTYLSLALALKTSLLSATRFNLLASSRSRKEFHCKISQKRCMTLSSRSKMRPKGLKIQNFWMNLPSISINLLQATGQLRWLRSFKCKECMLRTWRMVRPRETTTQTPKYCLCEPKKRTWPANQPLL